MTRERITAVALALCIFSCESEAQDLTFQSPEAEEALADAFAAAEQIAGMRSLLVGQDGQLVAEGYFNGTSASSLHDVRSVTKSVLSTLIGIAIDRGFIESTEQTLAQLLGPMVEGLEEEKRAITIDNLLTMTPGHEWRGLGASPSEFGEWLRAPDQLAYILDKPLVYPPGTRFHYSSGSSHLLSVILTEATGMNAADFAAQYLFAPLGIDSRPWLADKGGYAIGGAGLQLTPRDMLTIGVLFLEHGMSDGRQVVSEKWVRTSTEAHISTNNPIPYGTDYGYQWWLGNANNHDFYFAMGFGGQFIVNVPDLRLVVVATCEWRYPAEVANAHWYAIIRLILDNVVPASMTMSAREGGG
jgi:CubicO group peptidase (beta-lactamase class C family)